MALNKYVCGYRGLENYLYPFLLLLSTIVLYKKFPETALNKYGVLGGRGF